MARPPAIWGRETFAMAVSSNSMKVARVTVIAISQGLMAFVRSKLVGSAMVVAAILASAVLRWWTRPIGRKLKRGYDNLGSFRLEENASWREPALAETHDCSDSRPPQSGIDCLVSVPRRKERVAALIQHIDRRRGRSLKSSFNAIP